MTAALQRRALAPSPACPRRAGAAPLHRVPSEPTDRRTPPRTAVAVAAGIVTAALLIVALGVVQAPTPPGATTRTPTAPSSVHVVRPGDTLWDLARRAHPGTDPRPIVDRLAAARGGSTLVVGEQIVVP